MVGTPHSPSLCLEDTVTGNIYPLRTCTDLIQIFVGIVPIA